MSILAHNRFTGSKLPTTMLLSIGFEMLIYFCDIWHHSLPVRSFYRNHFIHILQDNKYYYGLKYTNKVKIWLTAHFGNVMQSQSSSWQLIMMVTITILLKHDFEDTNYRMEDKVIANAENWLQWEGSLTSADIIPTDSAAWNATVKFFLCEWEKLATVSKVCIWHKYLKYKPYMHIIHTLLIMYYNPDVYPWEGEGKGPKP